ncbi:hypothetical protein, partial [Ursidibacter arcticus]
FWQKGQVFYSFSKKCVKALYYKLLTHFLATILSITPKLMKSYRLFALSLLKTAERIFELSISHKWERVFSILCNCYIIPENCGK